MKDVVILTDAGQIGIACAFYKNMFAKVIGTDFLIDGGATASYYYGELKPTND